MTLLYIIITQGNLQKSLEPKYLKAILLSMTLFPNTNLETALEFYQRRGLNNGLILIYPLI